MIKPIQPQQPNAPPPTKQKLEMMLMNGEDFVPTVQAMIEKHKLPYTIHKTDNTDPRYRWILKNIFTQGETWLNKFITEHPDMLEMKRKALLMAPTEYPVLICGETGTGKELIAKSMIGSRIGSIKAVNCAGFPEHLIESELFGHIQGAFTGADRTKDGLMTAAENGVMFLDEIGEMPLNMQAKLLRAIQDKVVRKVGSNREEFINCKFVFATNRDLKKMVDEGTFRKDLYARISVLELNTYPLYPERKCDLIPICKSIQGGEKFVEQFSARLLNGGFDLSYNVRSLERWIIRYNVLGASSV